MKCPKCGYLGFERVERCRNCGYDFSLSSSSTVPDLSIRSSIPDNIQPLADLSLVDAALTRRRSASSHAATPDLQRGTAGVTAGPGPELPLFGSPIADDVPLITRPSPPRTPLAVRRASLEVPRVRAEARSPMLDFIPPDVETRPVASRVSVERKNGHGLPERQVESAPVEETAGVIARICAVVIDLAVLAAIDAAVVYFTMKISGVTVADAAILPKGPLIAFLILQNISYFVAFTAGGQTLGQMALGIKVVSDEAGSSPDLSHAILRTLIWAILVMPAGLGLVTALFSSDRRGLHDRCAGTRVVRATA
jgi:uncharacterized RDD family membrane protein YckC